jgi:alpha-beta hydrolase superfamily lysophospholipase
MRSGATRTLSRCLGFIALFATAFGFAPVDFVAAAPACQEGTLPSGALYRICVPDSWNQKLVLYAHGYVAPTEPLRLPSDELSFDGVNIVELLTNFGYAFATTSYRTNGLALTSALDDLQELASQFSSLYTKPAETFLVGASDGGLVATLAAERYPNLYDSVLSLCGPNSGLDLQTNYFGDFRVLFDYFYPNLMPPTPVEIPPALLESWETTTYSTTVRPTVFDPANAELLTQLLTAADVPHSAQTPTETENAVERLLWYNVYATNDARVKMGGQPYENILQVYSGSKNDDKLNHEVQRFVADAAARAFLDSIQPSGALRVPLLTVHTEDDPIVPSRHSEIYSARVETAGAARLLEATVIDRYGHCSFSALELLTSFNRMVERTSERLHFVYLPRIETAD